MGQMVVAGAEMMCTFGEAPAVLDVEPMGITAGELPAANIFHMAPLINIPTFGMCNTITNPVVAAATAAKLGVFTPAPCVPATVTPWAPGSIAVKLMEMPALTNTCTCECTWGGVITIEEPGQFFAEAT